MGQRRAVRSIEEMFSDPEDRPVKKLCGERERGDRMLQERLPQVRVVLQKTQHAEVQAGCGSVSKPV